ncbi:ferredoxin [Candidatus Bathyarchaeota archaeon]|nr:ferredoxin [Candidatus Bathyarchaeota archaeon]
MIISSEDAERDAVLSAARLMVTAARTAPKAGGRDSITTAILIGDDKEKLADELEKMGKEKGPKFFIRDAQNVRDADAIVLIGVKIEDESRQIMKLIDLGIAIGSAVKTASILNIDNRIMFSAGRAAEKMGIIEGKIQGIPLSVKGKNIFFDRKPI